jgi:hypothetical protein
MIIAFVVAAYLGLVGFNGYVCGKVEFNLDFDRAIARILCALFAPICFLVCLAWLAGESGERARQLQDEQEARAKELRDAKHRLELAALTEQTEDVKRLTDGDRS